MNSKNIFIRIHPIMNMNECMANDDTYYFDLCSLTNRTISNRLFIHVDLKIKVIIILILNGCINGFYDHSEKQSGKGQWLYINFLKRQFTNVTVIANFFCYSMLL